jgi:hypothetical protein
MTGALLVLTLATQAPLSKPGGPQQGITWLKLEDARSLAGKTGKLVLVYVACDPKTGSTSCGTEKADRAFGDGLVLARRKDAFHYVRLCCRKTAESLKATTAPEAIFIDGDGLEYHRSVFADPRSLDRAMAEALEKYAPRPVPWVAYEGKLPAGGEEGKRLVLLAFTDEKKESAEALKVLEDRRVVKLHERFHFLRASLRRDPEEAKRWGVTTAPTLLVVDPAKGETLERQSGRKDAAEVKALLLRAISKLDKK